ncbi:MAG: RDD family protein [Nitrososphaerales archaeon]
MPVTDEQVQKKESQNKEIKRKYSSSEIFFILAHDLRKDILCLIHDKVEVSYSEILATLNIEDGLLNFHLRKMKPLVKLTREGTYTLSEKGKLAYSMLCVAEDKLRGEYPLRSLSKDPSIYKKLFLKRLLAFLIDFIILFFFTMVFLDEHFWHFINSLVTLSITYMDILSLLYDIYHNHAHLFFLGYVIFTLLEAHSGQTLGKYFLRIRVVKIEERRLTLMDSAIRNLGKVFLLPLDLLLGFLFYYKLGYIKFFDFLIKAKVEEAIAINKSTILKEEHFL